MASSDERETSEEETNLDKNGNESEEFDEYEENSMDTIFYCVFIINVTPFCA